MTNILQFMDSLEKVYNGAIEKLEGDDPFIQALRHQWEMSRGNIQMMRALITMPHATLEEAREVAATAWCSEKTQNKVMDPDLAEEFALILLRNCKGAIGSPMTQLTKALKEDADYAWSWFCNLRMSMRDAGVNGEQATSATERFMRLAFGVVPHEPIKLASSGSQPQFGPSCNGSSGPHSPV